MTHICIISDGKAGHVNQSLGLAEALARLRHDIRISTHPPLSRTQALKTLLTGRSVDWKTRPDLVIGAGHGTHLTLLALKRAYRVPAVVLMTPSLPLTWFDLCLIPEHDKPAARDNVLSTRGALNRMRPGEKDPDSGMILIGGPSKHSGWDEPALLAQLQKIIGGEQQSWSVTTSRRTPESTERMLAELDSVEFIPVSATGQGWLPERLARVQSCWVTEDSVSMVYEALSAGCAVGTLPVPGGASRLSRGLNSLAEKEIITPLSHWRGERLPLPLQRFDEATRCAEQILNRGLI